MRHRLNSKAVHAHLVEKRMEEDRRAFRNSSPKQASMSLMDFTQALSGWNTAERKAKTASAPVSDASCDECLALIAAWEKEEGQNTVLRRASLDSLAESDAHETLAEEQRADLRLTRVRPTADTLEQAWEWAHPTGYRQHTPSNSLSGEGEEASIWTVESRWDSRHDFGSVDIRLETIDGQDMRWTCPASRRFTRGELRAFMEETMRLHDVQCAGGGG